ncbi:MAG: ABC transporter permease, partial [Acidobacteria bacterium]|nr:ABC transporter permease [Acidobacteriota bacterium]
QFLMESACVAVLGGLLGIVLAGGVTQVVTWLSPVPASFSLSLALEALAISGAVGLFFGIYPASRAARLDPIAALRAEGS